MSNKKNILSQNFTLKGVFMNSLSPNYIEPWISKDQKLKAFGKNKTYKVVR